MKNIAIILGLLCILSISQHSSARTTDDILVGNDGLKLISKILKQDNMLPAEIKGLALKNLPVFVFLPGILGSKLINKKGEVIWGKGAAKNLTYDITKEVTVELLDEYETVIANIDIYGKFFKTVDELCFTDTKHLLIFPYDWRQDNRKSAEQLNNKLLSEDWINITRDREVILVAHSMGGIVASYMFFKYYLNNQAKYPFKISHLIYLGTPHRGSIACFQMLYEGYNSDPNANWLFKTLENNFLFSELNRVGYTFSSAYQLLPSYDDNIVKLTTSGRGTLVKK